jgi:2-dehydro-3-deoxygluconokinase
LPEVIGLGEIMVVMDPLLTGPLRYVEHFRKTIGGAEGNVCIGISRLGHTSGWIGRVGNDEFGRFIISFLKGEGVDISCVKVVEGFTGLYFKERRGLGDTKAYYYRKNSAGSTISWKDIVESYLEGAKFFHTTGITLALSDSSKEGVKYGLELAKNLGILVSFDVNLRLKLWKKEDAKREIPEIISKADLIFLTQEEGDIIFDTRKPEVLIEKVLSMGPEIVCVKLGKEGVIVGNSKGELHSVPAFDNFHSVDNIGAGDGFVAGFLVGQLKSWSLKDSALLGNIVGAYATTVTGDVEGLPTWQEVEEILGGKEVVRR